MTPQTEFMPHRQFHILVSEADEEHDLTLLPGTHGSFRVIKQGEVLGEVSYTPQSKIVCYKGRLKQALMDQLEKHISMYYTYAF
jgi:hypothetical protein